MEAIHSFKNIIKQLSNLTALKHSLPYDLHFFSELLKNTHNFNKILFAFVSP